MSFPILYEKNSTNFDTMGMGMLSDAHSCFVYEERNGIYELEMTYPIHGAHINEIKNERILKVDASHKAKNQRFKIYRITKPLNGLVTVYAEHISYKTQDLQLKPEVTFSGNARQALQTWKDNLVDDNGFTIFSDITLIKSGKWTIDKIENARTALGGNTESILNNYGGEYEFDNNHIMLWANRGKNNGSIISYGKNLLDLEQEEEISSTYTSIYPYILKQDEDQEEILITLPEYYVDSPNAKNFANRKILRVDFSQEEISTVEELRERAKKYIEQNRIGIPKVNLKVKFIDLEKTLDYENLKLVEEVNLCDWLTVYFEELDIQHTAKVIKTTWDVLLERWEEVEIGEARANLSSTIDTTIENKMEPITKEINTVRLTADGKNRVYRSISMPEGGQKNDIWYQPVGSGEVKMHIHDGVSWNEEAYSADDLKGTINFANINTINLTADAISGGVLDLDRGITIGSQGKPVLRVDSATNQVEMNISKLQINSIDAATKKDLEDLELDSGKSAYEIAVDAGFQGTEEEWLESLKGQDGSNGTPGKPGQDGKTPYIHIAYASSEDGSQGFSITDSSGKSYIGQYTDFVQADSTDYKKYTWSKFKGEDGKQGPQGIPGPKGSDGASQWTHIRYSANSNGSSMTTNPSSTTKYIGIAITNSSTAPAYTSFTWSKFVGENGSQGPQGIAGKPGSDGKTTYTWVRYADDKDGSGISQYPEGKRFIGLAFNKTTPAESNTASDYKWSEMPQNIEIGGRNLLRNTRFESTDFWESVTDRVDGYNSLGGLKKSRSGFEGTSRIMMSQANRGEDKKILQPGETYTISGWFYIDSEIPLDGSNNGVFVRKYQTETTSLHDLINIPINLDTYEYDKWYYFEGSGKVRDNYVGNEQISLAIARNGSIIISGLKLEKGNIATDWTEAPEDIQDELDKKAQLEDLENLGEIVSDIGSAIENKADADALESMMDEYNERINQSIEDKEKLADNLATLEGRTTLVETIAGESKLVTDFVDTVITEANEGIQIKTKDGKSSILIGTDRISFIDSGTEVAYISNQTMEITHGIFVRSATISGFKFETIPGTEILSITWVGNKV